jgi:hypothetical protein
MLKWVYGVLIAAFIAMVVGGAVSKAKDSWQAQQRGITMMQESEQKQRQKYEEIRDRIARTQAQPTPPNSIAGCCVPGWGMPSWASP